MAVLCEWRLTYIVYFFQFNSEQIKRKQSLLSEKSFWNCLDYCLSYWCWILDSGFQYSSSGWAHGTICQDHHFFSDFGFNACQTDSSYSICENIILLFLTLASATCICFLAAFHVIASSGTHPAPNYAPHHTSFFRWGVLMHYQFFIWQCLCAEWPKEHVSNHSLAERPKGCLKTVNP